MQADQSAGLIARLQQLITMSRKLTRPCLIHLELINVSNRTAVRKTVWKIEDYTTEPDSKAQCMALEDNVKEFGVTYFGIKDRRQGKLHV